MGKSRTSKQLKTGGADLSILNFFFTLLSNIKTTHFMTTSFAVHKATDGLYDKINDLSDKFIETFLGKYGRPVMEIETLRYKYMEMKELTDYLKECIRYLTIDIKTIYRITEQDTDILNIRDEIVGEINKALYLLTLS